MSHLRPFSFNATVQPVEGRHDKLTLWIDHRIYHGSPSNIQLFKMALATTAPNHMFKQPGGSPISWMRIRTGRRRGTTAPLPLFQGEYRFQFPRMYEMSEQPVYARWQLNLNPTRFVRHQNPSEYIPGRRMFPPRTAVFFERELAPELEFALDDQDNWIPDSPQFENLADFAFWPRILRDYLAGVFQLTDSATTDAASVSDLLSEPYPTERRFNVRYIETYFEFADPNAVHTVSSLEELLLGFSEMGMTAKDWRIAGPHRWRGHSRCVTIKIRTGVLLKVYAKTNKRVRFEVMYDLAGKALIPKLPSESTPERVRHTARDLDGIYRILERARTDAAKVVNDVLAHMQGRAALPGTPKTAVDFLLDVAYEIGNTDDARLIVWLLIERGSITSNARLKPLLRKLRRAGILRVQPRNRRREYIETQPYQHPVAMLRAYGAFPHLTARRRTRTPLPSG